MTSAEDEVAVQRERIKRIAGTLTPDAKVIFDHNCPPPSIRFRIECLGINLMSGAPHFDITELAGRTDEQIAELLEVLTNGRMRRPLT